MPFVLKSSAFRMLDPIPKEYTCEGADRAPPLSWEGPPRGTVSFAIVVDDPDAPHPSAPTKPAFVHWIAYDIPVKTRSLPEVAPLPTGARMGKNGFGRTGYSGPCKPSGKHRIYFRIYALDAMLGDLRTPTRSKLDEAMKGHILGQAVLMVTCEKGKVT